jgi:hypothetical protein
MNKYELKILALYLLVRANREGCNQVTLTNDCLKKCMDKDRICSGPLDDFAQCLRPTWNRPTMRAITVNDGLIVAVNDVRGTLSP